MWVLIRADKEENRGSSAQERELRKEMDIIIMDSSQLRPKVLRAGKNRTEEKELDPETGRGWGRRVWDLFTLP